jgi:hypothetical protein
MILFSKNKMITKAAFRDFGLTLILYFYVH